MVDSDVLWFFTDWGAVRAADNWVVAFVRSRLGLPAGLILLGGSVFAVADGLLADGSAAQTAVFQSAGVLAFFAVMFGARRHLRGRRLEWWLLSGVVGCWTLADAIYHSYPSFGGGVAPYPSLADVFYLLGYGCAIAMVVVLIRANGRVVLGDVLDMLVLATAGALVVWTFVVESATGSPAAFALTVAYPAFDLLLLVGLVQLAVGAVGATPSARLLALGAVPLLVSDVLYVFSSLQTSYDVGAWFDAGWVFSYALWAASAWAPASARGRQAPATRISRGRLAILFVAAAAAPLVYFHHSSEPLYNIIALSVIGVAMMALVFARMALLSREVAAANGALREAEARREADEQLRSHRSAFEQELRASEERFRAAFDEAPIGILLARTDGSIVRANHALTEMLGYSDQELTGIASDALTHEDDRAQTHRLAEQLLAGEVARYTQETRYVRKDGTVIEVRLDVAPVRTQSGKAAHLIAQIQDVTQRNRLEEQLRQAQKTEAIGRLAGGVAHDFNNLLTGITGFSELGLAAANEPEKVRHSLVQISLAAERAAGLTQQLLAFGRRQSLVRRPLSLNAIVEQYADMLQRLLGSNIAIELRLDPDLGTVLADETQTGQVLLNLAVNARDAMHEGGALTIETRNTDIDAASAPFTGADPGRYASLIVTDTGHGMSAETRAQIFDPFFTTKGIGEGTGLGLATVLGIVKQSGGGISVYSEPGHGTTFKIYLPRTNAKPETSKPAKTAPRHGTGTVLLVEDEPVVMELTRELLEKAGYNVIPAADPNQALTLAASGIAIDLLMTDVVMPGMNGRKLAEQLHLQHPTLKVLYTSGYTADILDDQSNPPFLQKPFTGNDLRQTVGTLLAS